MARPTEYGIDILNKANEYLLALPTDEKVHSIEGLSDYINIARSTIYKWCGEKGKEAFSDIVEAILNKQGKTLINKGLTGDFTSAIAKVMLSKHGYREGVDTDITTKGEKIESSEKVKELEAKFNAFIKGDNSSNPA